MVGSARATALAGPPAKKFAPRDCGPGSDAVGKPPEAPYLTAVNVPPEGTVQSGTATVLPLPDPGADSAPGFLIRFGGAPVTARAAPGTASAASAASRAAGSTLAGIRQDRRTAGPQV